MKNWPWTGILTAVGCLLLVAGVGPLAFILWEGAHAQPLSMPLLLKRGEYTSPYFRTYLSGDYQVQMEWAHFPDPQAPLDLDWRIVDAGGAVLDQGTYNDRLRGANNVNLGEYRAKFGQRQRIITRVHQDVDGESANAQLEIGQPEISLDLSYGFFLFLGWAGIAGGPGAILLIVLMIRRVIRKNAAA